MLTLYFKSVILRNVLGLLEIFKGYPLEKIEDNIDLTELECLNFYRLNKGGYVIGIYIDNLGFRGVIPSQICELNFLEELRLADGSLSRIPEEIGLLTLLRVLDLYDNRISHIPKVINKLTLRLLELQGNRITEIPRYINNLKDLQYRL